MWGASPGEERKAVLLAPQLLLVGPLLLQVLSDREDRVGSGAWDDQARMW